MTRNPARLNPGDRICDVAGEFVVLARNVDRYEDGDGRPHRLTTWRVLEPDESERDYTRWALNKLFGN